jgi:hypothetical protein
MVDCEWLGFIGYIFAFILFFIGIISSFLEIIISYRIGKKFGWSIKINNHDKLLSTPRISIITNIILTSIGIYFFIYKLGFVIIPNYWDCLMGIGR